MANTLSAIDFSAQIKISASILCMVCSINHGQLTILAIDFSAQIPGMAFVHSSSFNSLANKPQIQEVHSSLTIITFNFEVTGKLLGTSCPLHHFNGSESNHLLSLSLVIGTPDTGKLLGASWLFSSFQWQCV